jgi:hypothetical protein
VHAGAGEWTDILSPKTLKQADRRKGDTLNVEFLTLVGRMFSAVDGKRLQPPPRSVPFPLGYDAGTTTTHHRTAGCGIARGHLSSYQTNRRHEGL